ncbi:MtnX-like HAD-IB family phosphatase [Candidatus Chrysopegis kryptomonas]|uniref:Haloacid Dehalogenase superfamily, subfamily IB, phosphoserine phosphatase-like/2,3-diketo-5-methylthio-1-phosphopentane phosphatase n=1 Tax=Candidatus Chryseopegocella kryptomonas TaxID=1633643 RepID=A0A0N7MY85_9BACT|nr:MtnX-like HAD-IB family phosphatase [Candidatus Chrysopegis kryptomonas]CUT03539.1 Haloacid Dehalogenase superfamily, subfamily IB, phosphoserine phosphatase-like/2,3-diketo-5-methylthio-1-phosphopentane phosphatase [Candidatus Chrysopegis kryptomonas]
MNIKVFCDFDGTITKNDVGDLFFETFGDKNFYRWLVERWRDYEISSKEMREKIAEKVKVDKDEMEKLILSQEIDPYFIDFVKLCRDNGIEIFIVSDGFDFYIKKILEKNGLDNVKFFSNKLWIEDGKVVLDFPYPDSVCRICGNCKRNHMLTLSADEDIIIYIGDGYSDRCPAEYADVVFGKKELLKFCRERNIPVYEFETFKDVIEQFQRFLSGKKKLRKRWQAELKRREVFMRE